MSSRENNDKTTSDTNGEETHYDLPQRRFILRLRVNEFDGDGHSWEDHLDAIHTFFKWAGISELRDENGKELYSAHVEPLQALELKQRTFHVVLDIQPQPNDNSNLDAIYHEIYRVHRKPDGDL